MSVGVVASEFEELVANKDKVLVVFSSKTCGPCKALQPKLDELSDNGLVVAKVDIEESGDLATRFMVRSVPTLILFKDGEASKTEIGNITMSKLKKMID